MLTIFVTQLISGGGALMEHPAQPSSRQGRQPPTVWILPLVQYLLRCDQVKMVHISQGYWNAKSPKPTTFLITTPAADGRAFLRWLEEHKTNSQLPAPIPMGHHKGIYHTAQLKRYRGPLCAGLAAIAANSADQIPLPLPNPNQDWVDPVLETALELKHAYDISSSEHDGADFHEFSKGHN